MPTTLYSNLSQIKIKLVTQEVCVNGYLMLGVPQKPSDKTYQPAYLHFTKMHKKLIKTCFNNFQFLTTKMYVFLITKLC